VQNYICIDGVDLHDRTSKSGSLWAVPTASSAECEACGEESAGLGRKMQVKLASVKQEVSSKAI